MGQSGWKGTSETREQARAGVEKQFKLLLKVTAIGTPVLALLGIATPNHSAAAGQLMDQLGLGAVAPMILAAFPVAFGAAVVVWILRRAEAEHWNAWLTAGAAVVVAYGTLWVSTTATAQGQRYVDAVRAKAPNPGACVYDGPSLQDASRSYSAMQQSPNWGLP